MQRRQKKSLDLVDGTIGLGKPGDWETAVGKWRREFEKILLDSHKTAARLGRNRAGNLRHAFRKDEALAKKAVKADKLFLDSFQKDLLVGRYGQGELVDKSSIDNRMFMYLDKARATANEAFGENSPKCEWERMMLAAEHCGTCPPKARTYKSWEELKAAGLPADGSDECLTRCECITMRLSDGRIGFGSAFEKLKPVMTDDGFVPENVYLTPSKIEFLTKLPKLVQDDIKGEIPQHSNKSGLVGIVGFDHLNRADLRKAILEFGRTHKLMEVETIRGERRFITIGDMAGPNGEVLKNVLLRWSEEKRRGLKFSTMVKPKPDMIKEYEEWLANETV